MRRARLHQPGNRLASRFARSFALTVTVLLLVLGGTYALVAYASYREEI